MKKKAPSLWESNTVWLDVQQDEGETHLNIFQSLKILYIGSINKDTYATPEPDATHQQSMASARKV